jgi:SOS-response transcriptional repressor LexA
VSATIRQDRTIAHPVVGRVYEYILAYKLVYDGNSPTTREIQAACGISSSSVVAYWLKRLECRGLIRLHSPVVGTRRRLIMVVGGAWNLKEMQ